MACSSNGLHARQWTDHLHARQLGRLGAVLCERGHPHAKGRPKAARCDSHGAVDAVSNVAHSRAMPALAANPINIIAQVPGSGTGGGGVLTPTPKSAASRKLPVSRLLFAVLTASKAKRTVLPKATMPEPS